MLLCFFSDLVDDVEVREQISEIRQEIKVNMERFRRANSDVKRRSSTNIRRYCCCLFAAIYVTAGWVANEKSSIYNMCPPFSATITCLTLVHWLGLVVKCMLDLAIRFCSILPPSASIHLGYNLFKLEIGLLALNTFLNNTYDS